MKTVPTAFLRVLAAFAGALLATSCVSTTPAVSEHQPRVDYWQNGGGACCPQHAKEFDAKREAAKKEKAS